MGHVMFHFVAPSDHSVASSEESTPEEPTRAGAELPNPPRLGTAFCLHKEPLQVEKTGALPIVGSRIISFFDDLVVDRDSLSVLFLLTLLPMLLTGLYIAWQLYAIMADIFDPIKF